MLLIVSGAYVESELFSEFGKVPPCFLPVGNKRLLRYQIDRFGGCYDRIDLTLPHDFELDEADEHYLGSNGIHLYRTEAGCPLAKAVCDYLDHTEISGQLDLLYGDTLIEDDALDGTDWLAVGSSDEYYHWYHEEPDGAQAGGTWAGMFSFSDCTLLRRKLAECSDFISAVTEYGKAVGKMERKHVAGWLDFGHVHTYFDSKRSVTTQRHFNHLSINNDIVTKSSADTKKMLAEAAWYENAPPQIRKFLPNFILKQEIAPVHYATEYLALATLSELYVFGRLPDRVWKKIFSACSAYFDAAASVPVSEPLAPAYAEATYYGKTIERLKTFSEQADISLDAPWKINGVRTPSLMAMACEAAETIVSLAPVASFIHGDFCFSNILFDFRCGRVKLVDPRGLDAQGRISAFGDFRYEIGKLAHSVLGLYDFIVAGHYFLNIDNHSVQFNIPAERTASVQRMFAKTVFRGRTLNEWDVYPVMLLLFLSMLPLHADDPGRQKALLANCLRIYLEWKHDHHSDGRK